MPTTAPRKNHQGRTRPRSRAPSPRSTRVDAEEYLALFRPTPPARLPGRHRGRRRPLSASTPRPPRRSRTRRDARRRRRRARSRRDPLHVARQPGPRLELIARGGAIVRFDDGQIARVLEPADRAARRLRLTPDAEIRARSPLSGRAWWTCWPSSSRAHDAGRRGDRPGRDAPRVRRPRPGAVRRPARRRPRWPRTRRARRSAGTSTARPTCSPTGRPPAPADGRSLILNGHIDVVSPEPASLWSARPVRAAPRRRVDLRPRRRRHEVRAGGDRRRRRRPAAARRRPARPRPAAVGRRGGVHRQRRARLRARRSPRRRRDPHRADPRRGLERPGRRAVVPGAASPARPPTPATRRAAATRSRRTYAVIAALRGLEAELNAVKPPLYAAYPHPINLNVGMISGGDWPSTVPGRVRHPLPARDLSRRAGRRPQGARRGDRRERLAGDRARGALRRLPVRGLRARARRAADHGPARRRRAGDRRGAAAVRVHGDDGRAHASSSTATRPPSASGRSPSASTASTSASTSRRSTTTAQAIALFIADWCGLSS